MALILDAVEAKFVAILESNLGGLMPSPASVLAIPAGQFRRSEHDAPLTDPAYPKESLDKAYELGFDRDEFPELPNNLAGKMLWDSIVTLSIGIVYGDAATTFVSSNGMQITAGSQVRTAKKFATSLSMLVMQAITYPAIFTDNTTDPQLYDCQPGPGRIVDVGGGRLVAQRDYTVRVYASTYAPYQSTVSS